MARVADSFNFAACRMKKQVVMRAQWLDSPSAESIASPWPSYFRTGQTSVSLQVLAGISLTGFAYSLVTPPILTITVKNSSGTTVVAKTWSHTGLSAGGQITPSEIHHVHDEITGLSPDTEYYLDILTRYGLELVYLSVAEKVSRYADDSLLGACNRAAYTVDGPIWDGDIRELVEANNALWRHNGAHLIAWAADYSADGAPGTAAIAAPTVYTNIIDAASTTVTAISPGFKLFTQYHNTTNRTTIPVKLAVKTFKITGVAGVGILDVKLTDGTNSIAITGLDIEQFNGKNGWNVVSGTIPAQNGTKWDIHVRVTGAGTHRLEGLCLFEFET